MNRGIVIVTYGASFDRLAAHTIEYSRRFTDLPITVFTNIKERHPLWNDVSNVEFIYRDEPDIKNRHIKLQLYKYTPYTETIYMDCDSVVQNKGLENVFLLLGNHDILLCPYGRFVTQRGLLSAYRKTYRSLGEHLPVRIYYGAFFVFRQCLDSVKFFDAWLNNWLHSGVRREMPALSVTVKRNKLLSIGEISPAKEIFSWRINKNCIVQHEYGNGRRFWKNFCESRKLVWNFLTD